MNNTLQTFEHAVGRAAPLLKKQQIEGVVDSWLDADVLKLQKAHWSNEGVGAGPAAGSEIFFSIWMEAKSRRQDRAFYNIHALRLRGLRAYGLQSREFAESFRYRLAGAEAKWPNISTDFGPQTLFQGWINAEESQFEKEIDRLIALFIPLSGIIDELLEARKRV